jgi:hypothetical protein
MAFHILSRFFLILRFRDKMVFIKLLNEIASRIPTTVPQQDICDIRSILLNLLRIFGQSTSTFPRVFNIEKNLFFLASITIHHHC